MKYLQFQLILFILFLKFLNIFSVWTKFDYKTNEKSYQIINSTYGNGPQLQIGSEFGHSIANIGDLNDDSIDDLVVGAIGETCIDRYGNTTLRCGAIYILFMKNDATVLKSVRITNKVNGGPEFLQANDNFGASVASAGDVDGDGIIDIIVGSTETSQGGSLYVLFMKIDGTVRSYQIIRGSYGNGPPISQFTRMGYALANLGDLDGDNRPEIAVSSYDSSNRGRVFIFTLFTNGTVKHYDEVILRNSTGYIYTPNIATGFGWSISKIGDLNNDGMTDIAIGSPLYTDSHGVKQGGAIFILLMNKTTVIDYHIANDSPDLKVPIQLQEYDRCGTSITTIGDINNDQLRTRYPKKPREKGTRHYGLRSIPDIVVGCTQEKNSRASGKFLFLFLNSIGSFYDFSFPPYKYPSNGPPLPVQSLFGTSMTYLTTPTIIEEYLDPLPIVIGSSQSINSYTDSGNGGLGTEVQKKTGCLYVVYLSRRRYHPPPFNIILYYLSILLPVFLICICIIISIIVFFIYFRRKPDEIEIAVKKAGVEIGLQRKRIKNIKAKDATVYADDYS